MPTYNNLPKKSLYFKGFYFEKLAQDLHLAGKAKRTVYGYIRAVKKLAEFSKRSPDKITEAQVRKFLLNEIVNMQTASGTQSVLLSGIKFFYRVTCPRDWQIFHQTKLLRTKSLPEVITQAQVFRLIDACKTVRLKTFIWTTYTLGLRIGETVSLQLGDIDSDRMMVHIHRGKGAKDEWHCRGGRQHVFCVAVLLTHCGIFEILQDVWRRFKLYALAWRRNECPPWFTVSEKPGRVFSWHRLYQIRLADAVTVFRNWLIFSSSSRVCRFRKCSPPR